MRKQREIPNELCERIDVIWRRLEAHYGAPVLMPSEDPLGELVSTILSQHTTDVSSAKAFQDLRLRYPDWQEVLRAPVDDVAEAIRFAGLPMQKARTIQAALAEVGDENLYALTGHSVEEARGRLTAIRGVGDKTASCVLLFALGMPAQPVDTHIDRVSKRLGVNNDVSNATGIQQVLEHCLPSDGQAMYAFHVDMVRHGREICQARSPKCGMCMLTDVCRYYVNTVAISG